MIHLPKGRKLARRWILAAFLALLPGGELFLAGANEAGIQSALKDARSLFGNAGILDYMKGCRIARLVKQIPFPSAPAWLQEPGVTPGSWLEIEASLGEWRFHLYSLPGVFSSSGIDEGTRLLIENMSIPSASKVLDLGCGYGLIGLVAALQGASSVDLIDVNLPAVFSAQKNLEKYSITYGRAFPSDVLSQCRDQSYDIIISNPPFHSGLSVDYQTTKAFIQGAVRVLEPGGRLILVANRFIRYEKELIQYFSQVEHLATTNRYHVLLATK